MPDLLAGAQDRSFGANFASNIPETLDEFGQPFLVSLKNQFLCPPDCDPYVIDKCANLRIVLDLCDLPVGIHVLHDLHKEYLCKCGALGATSNNPIAGHAVNGKCVITLESSACHVHL